MKPATIRVKKDIYERARAKMVEDQLLARGIKDKRVLHAMRTIPRHIFVDDALTSQAYTDFPLPIGEKQTISQPFMVAFMSESLGLAGTERVLEIGSGSGYQSAVLSMLSSRVYSVERLTTLTARARRTLDRLHCSNVVIKLGDGTTGWAEEAPFDAIIAAAASPQVPAALVDQLAPGGRLIIPVGSEETQKLLRITRRANGVSTEVLGGCRFVKLIGKDGWQAGKKDALIR